MPVKKLALLMFTLMCLPVNASVINHYKAKTFIAQSVKVLSPSLLEIQAYFTKDLTNLSKVYIRTNGLIFDEGDQEKCDEDVISPNCQRLMDEIKLATVQFQLADNVGKSSFTGIIYINGVNLRHTMLREGWYKFDYKKSRSHYDILLQKEAECKRKGIWSNVIYEPTDLRCQ
ncbi:MAG: hypothetical protein ACJAXJ_003538 [Colwellia sp.]|jgi:hypothetical protein